MALIRNFVQPVRQGIILQNQIYPTNSSISIPSLFWGCQQQQVRYRQKANRHWLEKWRGFRRLKV